MADSPSAPVRDVADPAVEAFNRARAGVKQAAEELAEVKRDYAKLYPPLAGTDHGEVVANLTLAYRHLEDASMRLGKAIQARDGGVSVYDQSTAVMNAR